MELIRLSRNDDALVDRMLTLFSKAFDDEKNYNSRRPGHGYLESLLSDNSFVAIVAVRDGVVVGALVAYELRKFEQERSEFYIYDLAVDEHCRREGVATALIGKLQDIAAQRGAWVIFVQADQGDDAAIGLYSKLGEREDVIHFDIPVRQHNE